MQHSKEGIWILLYWMPYDNNLAQFERPIIDMLASGLINDWDLSDDRCLVLVQADHPAKPMTRYIISKDSISTESTSETDSSDAESLEAFLTWATARFRADHWMLSFLGHGGRLDEFSPDESASADGSTKWMRIDAAANVVHNLMADQGLKLLFLQNCCKGTLEAHYAFRDCADYTLSSQTVLGAPNYYYKEMLRHIRANPNMDAKDLANSIMENERPDMYNGYCLTDNRALGDLPCYLNRMIAATVPTKDVRIEPPRAGVYSYAAESLMDVGHFLRHLVETTGQGENELLAFDHFFNHHLVARFHESPESEYPRLSGLSALLPSSKKKFLKYQHLDFYRDTQMERVFRAFWRARNNNNATVG